MDALSSRVIPFPEHAAIQSRRASGGFSTTPASEAHLSVGDEFTLAVLRLAAVCAVGLGLWLVSFGGLWLAINHGPGTTPVAVYASGAVVR